MPKAAQYRLSWHAEQQVYELREHPGGDLLTVTPGEQAWFAWLDTIPSFTFWGKLGQLTVRKESRQWGEGYWYAYHRVGPKLTKKYLGRTADLTLARLEETAAMLSGAEIAPAEEAAVGAPLDERVHSIQHFKGEVNGDEPAVSKDATSAPSDKMRVQRDPLLFTKLHVPRPRAQLVPRSHLVEQLQQGMLHTLTLVSAPAGFGKTTLLAQWLAESDKPVAWLSLEPEDNDPIRFLTYLIAALQTRNPSLGVNILELLEASRSTPLESALIVLTNDIINRQIADFVLVLDDYHVITSEAIHRAMVFLIEHLPPQLHLILATRADPPLPSRACALAVNLSSCVLLICAWTPPR